MFTTELNFFIENQASLVEMYLGKYIVLKGNKVVGVYDSALQAYLEAQKKHKIGSFMIQSCIPGPEAYTVTISPTSVARF